MVGASVKFYGIVRGLRSCWPASVGFVFPPVKQPAMSSPDLSGFFTAVEPAITNKFAVAVHIASKHSAFIPHPSADRRRFTFCDLDNKWQFGRLPIECQGHWTKAFEKNKEAGLRSMFPIICLF
jgi:hypothetical protein